MTGELLRQSAFASGFDAGRARAEAEVQRLKAENAAMREVVEAAHGYYEAVERAVGHQSDCLDSPCDACDQTSETEGAAESRLFAALDRLDAAEKARTATPEGPQSAPSSQPPQPEQAT